MKFFFYIRRQPKKLVPINEWTKQKKECLNILKEEPETKKNRFALGNCSFSSVRVQTLLFRGSCVVLYFLRCSHVCDTCSVYVCYASVSHSFVFFYSFFLWFALKFHIRVFGAFIFKTLLLHISTHMAFLVSSLRLPFFLRNGCVLETDKNQTWNRTCIAREKNV